MAWTNSGADLSGHTPCMNSESVRGLRHFLYPLNPTSDIGYRFGKHPTSYAGFLATHGAGQVAEWGLATNYRRIEDGDYIWAYFVEPPDGAIRAVGRVRGDPYWEPEWKKYSVRIEWDQRLTKRLARDPIRYSTFRQRISAGATEANEGTLAVLKGWLGGKKPGLTGIGGGEVTFVNRQIKARRGQPKFRNALMEAYGSRCVITGCSEPDALEAAHILSVRRKGRHSVQNGLLLRADIHTIFDRGLIVVDNDYTVQVHRSVTDKDYRALHGKKLHDLESNPKRPTKKKLREHRKAKGW